MGGANGPRIAYRAIHGKRVRRRSRAGTVTRSSRLSLRRRSITLDGDGRSPDVAKMLAALLLNIGAGGQHFRPRFLKDHSNFFGTKFRCKQIRKFTDRLAFYKYFTSTGFIQSCYK